MDHYRLRKYRGPEVWARVRQAYEAGESGPSVALRFDVGLANIRKKSRREGWSRRHQAERADHALPPRVPGAVPGAEGPVDPIDPPEAPVIRRRALDRAAALLAAGRAAEALAQLKAAEALARLDAVESAAAAREPTEAEEAAGRRELGRIVEVRAAELAHEMLAEGVRPGVRWGGYALRWRAETYGAEAAEADRRAAEAEGWAGRYWDESGALREREAGEMGWGE